MQPDRNAENPGFHDVAAHEAEGWIVRDEARVLDVRTAGEFMRLGHIPGAMLLPVDRVASGLATLPRDGKRLVVCCEHGIRSVHAAQVLAIGGFEGVYNLVGGMAEWTGPRSHDPPPAPDAWGPAAWLLHCADLLPREGQALDVACGTGRHAILLAAIGLEVVAVDRDEGKLATLADQAQALGLRLEARAQDLEVPDTDLGEEAFDLIVGVHYLHRPLFPALRRALKKGGLLLYETFTEEQALRGKPTNPAFLLRSGELRELVRPLEVLREREGEHEGRCVASVAARRQR